MKKCSLCGWENGDERSYCRRCGGHVTSMSPLSSEGRKRARIGVLACRALGLLAILCGLALFFWPPIQGTDSEGPGPYIRGIRVAVAAVLAYVFLRVGSYFDWRGKGVMP